MSEASISVFEESNRISISLETPISPKELIPISTIGRGSYGKVILAKVKDNEKRLVAMKIIPKSKIQSLSQIGKLQTELKVLRDVATSSPFLICSRGAFQTRNCLLMIMPYAAGGELLFHLQKLEKFDEIKSRLIIMQVILGLEALHERGVVYRDLKPENVLITNEGRCQLCDFGLSKFLPMNDDGQNSIEGETAPKKSSSTKLSFTKLFRRKEKPKPTKPQSSTFLSTSDSIWGTTKTRCGSPVYQSPQMVNAEEYGLETDWWALGVFLYELLTGRLPFYANSVKEVYTVILQNNPTYPTFISEKAKSLISELLTSNRRERLGYRGVEDVKYHRFFTELDLSDRTQKEDFCTWDMVSSLNTPPVVYLSDAGYVTSPENTLFFSEKYTSIQVREGIVPVKSRVVLEGFSQITDVDIDQFLFTS